MSEDDRSKIKTSGKLLKYYWELKKSRREKLSLRGISKDLEVSHNYLSELFNDKKKLSPSKVEKFCEVLEIDDVGERILKQCILRENGTSEVLIQLAESLYVEDGFESENFIKLEGKETDILSEWYYTPLMTLIDHPQFSDDPQWLADRLDINIAVVERAWRRLVDMGVVYKEEERWKRKVKKMRVSASESKNYIRYWHSLMLKKAHKELVTKTDQESFDKRLMTGGTAAVTKEGFEKVKGYLSESLYHSIKMLDEEKGERKQVYQIAIQFFPLTND